MNRGIASAPEETEVGEMGEDAPVEVGNLMERVVVRANLIAALRKVERNGGSPGIDGMRVEQLQDYLMKHWPSIKKGLFEGTHRPMPVKRIEIPKPGGGKRVWAYRQYLIGLSNRRYCRYCRKNGMEAFPTAASVSDRGVRPIKRRNEP